jgi:hypothetical protein
VLADEGWRAYREVGDCVHTMLSLFRHLLPEPLDEVENRVFERVHLRQWYFGNLPAMMLAERFPWLYPILAEVWEEPDNSEAVAVMHRLLAYYAEMSADRRAVDCLAAARRDGAQKAGQVPVVVELDSGQAPRTDKGGQKRLDKLAQALGLECECASPKWCIHVLDHDAEEAPPAAQRPPGCTPSIHVLEHDAEEALFILECSECSFSQQHKMTPARLRELVQAIEE